MCIITQSNVITRVAKSWGFQDWKLSMGINGNKTEISTIAGTGNLNVVEKNLAA